MALLYGSNLDPAASPMGNVGFNHSRVRVTSCVYTGTPTDADDLVFGIFKTNDRIKDIRVSVIDGSATAGAVNIGVWTADTSNNGLAIAVVDADRFASAFAINADIAYPGTSVLEEAATLTIADRGKMLYEQAGVAADPGGNYAIVGEVSTTADAAVTLLVEIDYVAGD
tara:strand:- start:273 stop:779 length:507 start_codon:yes stop_codon:yes gene_type:complete